MASFRYLLAGVALTSVLLGSPALANWESKPFTWGPWDLIPLNERCSWPGATQCVLSRQADIRKGRFAGDPGQVCSGMAGLASV